MRRIFVLLCLLIFSSQMVYADPGRAIAFLLDVSKSIPAQDFEKAKLTIQHTFDQSGANDVHWIYPFGSKVQKISPAELAGLQRTESYTMVYDAAYEAAKDLSSVQADSKKIVIFSDGYDTNSVLTIEDLVSFARKENIRIYSVGLGDSNRRVLERIAKLTGAMYFHAEKEDSWQNLEKQLMAVEASPVNPPAAAKPAPAQVKQNIPAATVPSPARVDSGPTMKTQSPLSVYRNAAAILLVLLLAGLILLQRSKARQNICPACGKKLHRSDSSCPNCTAETKIQPVPQFSQSADTTQELSEALEEFQEGPVEWPERSQKTQEILSRTFVLVDTPVLFIKRGAHRGKSFALQPDQPLSIGRSRVNEIRLEDEAVSAQHCRIIPESGQYVLYDLESTNGTYVGDEKVRRAILNNGDTIKIGDTYFTYKIRQSRE